MADIRPDTQNRVQLRPVTDAKFEAQDFGAEKIGRGLAAFGQGLQQVAQDVADIEAIHDEAAVKRVDTEALAAEAAARRDVINATGEAALSAREGYDGRVSSIREEALSKLRNDRQKRMFTDVFTRRNVADLDTVQRHVDKETRTYAVESAGARARELGNRAIDNYSNPEEFDKSILSVVSEIETIGLLQGRDAQMRKLDKDEAVSGVYAGVVDMLAVDDPLGAHEYLNTYAAQILPDLVTKLRQRLHSSVEEARVDTDVNAIISNITAGAYGNTAEGTTNVPAVDPAKADAVATVNSNPLREKGKTRVRGGQFGAPRDGGARAHNGLDYPAPAGTPVYPRIHGKVVEVDTVGKTNAGFFVRVQYDDGHTASYSHLRNVNVAPGDRVDTNTVLGGVGGTGKGGKPVYGNHLHEVVRGPDGALIDPEKYKPKATKGDAATPGYKPKYDGEWVNLEAAYADVERLAEENQWSPTYKKKVLAGVDDYARRQDLIRDRAFDAADDAASETLVEIIRGGGDLTDPVKQIPNFQNLSPASQMRLINQAESTKASIAAANAAAAAAANKATIEGNYSAYLDLEMMAESNPDQFMKVPLDGLRGSFPESDWKRLKKTQEEYRRQGTYRPQLAPERSKVSSLISSVLGDAGINPKNLKDPKSQDAKRRAYLITEAMREIDAYNQGGTKLTDEQIMELVIKPKLRKVVVEIPGFFGTNEEEMPWYQATMEGYSSARVAR
ncbi:MAG: M23 family metallopeptidase [Casimicrobium sp.]